MLHGMYFSEIDDFKRDFKKLAKKYPTLEEDFAVAKKAITACPAGNGSRHWNIFKKDGSGRYILKSRMMCRAVKGAQFRLVYFYDSTEATVEFIELYFKSNKERENVERIKKFFAKPEQT